MDFKELSKMDAKTLMNTLLKGGGGKSRSSSGRKMPGVLGLDFGAESVYAVRLKKSKNKIELLGADILSRPEPGATEMKIPSALVDLYAALCSDFPGSSARVFNYTPNGEYKIEDVVRSNLNVEDDFRVGGMLVKETRREHLIFGVSAPSAPVEEMLGLFADGAPALCSVELSGLASSAAFFAQKEEQTKSRTICLIEGGLASITASFFVGNELQIVNQFAFGKTALLKALEKGLGVDLETADDIAKREAVDISLFVQDVLGSVSKQLSISREFVERQSHSRLSGCYISGALAQIPAWGLLLKKSMEVAPEVWNPFESFVLPDAGLPEGVKGQEPLFASAVGVALSSMEI